MLSVPFTETASITVTLIASNTDFNSHNGDCMLHKNIAVTKNDINNIVADPANVFFVFHLQDFFCVQITNR